MPTPFYHLHVAEEILNQPGFPQALRQRISSERGAFLLGNTAPDVQVVSGQERPETHFFTLPIRPDSQPAWDRMLAVHPVLARPENLPSAQTAFLAGYLCHLQADWSWIRDIFLPVFGPTRNWGTFPERLYLHNVLRAYLDRQIMAALPEETAALLSSAEPAGWLPFVEDRYLREWRDWVARQLEPGAEAQTVEVFAARQGISPQTFYQLLDSEERMDEEVFSHLARSRVHQYRERLIESNLLLLQTYLATADKHPRPDRSGLTDQTGVVDTLS